MSLLTIANNINRLCPGLNPAIVKSFIQDSYLQLSRMEWNMLILTRNFHTIAPYTTGTISVDALGVVTGVGTAFTSAMEGRWMRVYYDNSLFAIDTVTSPTELDLTDWPGDILSAQTYSILTNIYDIPSPINLIFDVAYQLSMPKKSQSYFNTIDPARYTTGQPVYWADAGINQVTRLPMIELFPIPDQVYPIRIYGKVRSQTLGDADVPFLPEDLIEAHALMACFRLASTLNPKMGWEQRLAEQTEWYKQVLDDARDEDYIKGSHADRVKDTQGEGFPMDDTFAVSHDVG